MWQVIITDCFGDTCFGSAKEKIRIPAVLLNVSDWNPFLPNHSSHHARWHINNGQNLFLYQPVLVCITYTSEKQKEWEQYQLLDSVPPCSNCTKMILSEDIITWKKIAKFIITKKTHQWAEQGANRRPPSKSSGSAEHILPPADAPSASLLPPMNLLHKTVRVHRLRLSLQAFSCGWWAETWHHPRLLGAWAVSMVGGARNVDPKLQKRKFVLVFRSF